MFLPFLLFFFVGFQHVLVYFQKSTLPNSIDLRCIFFIASYISSSKMSLTIETYNKSSHFTVLQSW